jgi:uncharacterized repeat protein (TIGR03809 family)
MTLHVDVARGRNVVARWCALAEQRLEYLTELFETGRWRRFHSERDFLENIQEAKTAVETWRSLLAREASLDNSAIDISWLGGTRLTLPRGDKLSMRAQPQPVLQPQQATPPAEPAVRDVSPDFMAELETRLIAPDAAPSAPEAPFADEMALPTLDLAVMQERYPLLRNAL